MFHHEAHLGIHESHNLFHRLLKLPDRSLEAGNICGEGGGDLGEGGGDWIFFVGFCMQLGRDICLGFGCSFGLCPIVGRGSDIELVGIQRGGDIGFQVDV